MSQYESSSNRKIDGVMIGIVTDNNDPAGLGRVKLNLPIREVENETNWARIATMAGGAGYGSYFVPEVGDEVLVAFHLGEVRQPYVIGALWNNNQPPPNAASAGITENSIRMIKTKAGHQLRFEDGKIEGKIILKARRNQSIEINDLMDSITITDGVGTNRIEINGGFRQNVSIRSGLSTIKMNADGRITISSKSVLTISGGVINISAKGLLNLSGKAGVMLKSSGPVMIKGAIIKAN